MKLNTVIETGREVFNAASLVDKAADRWADSTALHHYDSGKSLTFKEVALMANRVGNALRGVGVEIENRVAILMDDCPEWVCAFLGALKVGAVICPLNTLLTEKDYAFFLSDTRAKVIFVGASYLDRIENLVPSLPYLKKVVVCGGGGFATSGGRVTDWATFIRGAAEDLEVEPTFATDLAVFAFTSGSTGRPRAIMRGHSAIMQQHSIFGIQEGDVQFYTAKLYFFFSIVGLLTAFKTGAPVVLLSARPTGKTVLEAIARYHPAFLAGAPTLYARMVEAADETPLLADLSSVRYVFCTGEGLPPSVFHRFKETFGKPLYNCWGSQEMGAPLVWDLGDEVPPDKAGSVGRIVVPGYEVKIVDECGNQVPAGVPGEIMVKIPSPFLFQGYWHDPEGTASKFVEGWYKPGDSLVLDKDGYYWYRGRLDDLAKVGGRQIFPLEVEETVARHPAVLEDAVVPVPNEQGLLELQAFVVLREGYDPSSDLATQIQAFVKEELAAYKRPNRVIFVAGLPRTGTGKIQRFRLREDAMKNRG